MPTPLPWIERTWTFDFPASLAPCIVARLSGTPARIDELVEGTAPSELTRRGGANSWSPQEHVGHFLDLEALALGRLQDFRDNIPTLRPADMSNQATWDARYNARAMPELQAAYRSARTHLVTQLEALDTKDWEQSIMHPRLRMPMRLVDLLLFQADHDDHHLALVSALLRRPPLNT